MKSLRATQNEKKNTCSALNVIELMNFNLSILIPSYVKLLCVWSVACWVLMAAYSGSRCIISLFTETVHVILSSCGLRLLI